MPQTSQLIGAAEAAEILGEDVRTVQRKAKTGEYPSQKMQGLRGAYVFHRVEIEALAERAA